MTTGTRRKAGTPKGKSVARGRHALDALAPGESTDVLKALLGRHPELRREAETIARDLLAGTDPESIASSVREAVLSPDLSDLGARAGRNIYGYVHETDAAWEILEEAVQPFLDDLRRLVDLNMQDKAVLFCCAIISGLYMSRHPPDGAVLAYAPHFPMETAGETADILARESRRKHRRVWSLPRGVVSEWPDWREMLLCASRRR